MTETNFDKRYSADAFGVDAEAMEALRSRCLAIAERTEAPAPDSRRTLRLAYAVPAMAAAVMAAAIVFLADRPADSAEAGDPIHDMIAAMSDEQLRLIGSATYDDIIFNEQL
ncbi:MAG: hypothetical protein K2J33_06695 [Alistipes sp.]|nr:hypothetical protein [Alistipes sp.]